MDLDKNKYKLLFKINDPSEIRKLELNDLKDLCQDIRDYMIDVVSETGGHFGGGLGAVELTVALHKVFNTPYDKIVWDVGHQAYPHKIITGRRDTFPTIRQFKGISGFLKRSESEYDVFGAGHASTSISAALGIAEAARLKGEDRKVIAVIGDGSMTGGMAYEALNNSGVLKSNIIVVLNDNNMSISKNVWQFSNYFTEMLAHPEVTKMKGAIWDFTGRLDHFGDRIRKVAHRLESGIKAVVTPGMLFEALGFKYFGPVRGHNLQQLIRLFERAKNINGPILIHTLTEKGKGYKPAEEDAQRWHGTTPFDKITGQELKSAQDLPSYTSIFGKTLVELVKENPKIVGITAAMPEGTGLNYLQKEIPSNFYDVGIAEEHAVTFAAGLATEGIIPVVAVYSTFLQRAFDQIIHDVALQKLHVVFVLDRAGLVGADGPTHHGTLDLGYLSLIPDMVVMSPKDENELRDMLLTAVNYKKGPIALRYPRGSALGVSEKQKTTEIEIGKAEYIQRGENIALLSIGNMTDSAIKIGKRFSEIGINPTIVNMRFAKPIDIQIINEVLSEHKYIVTLEENSILGGIGSTVADVIVKSGRECRLLKIGLPDEFIEHGTQKELFKLLGLDDLSLFEKIKTFYTDNK